MRGDKIDVGALSKPIQKLVAVLGTPLSATAAILHPDVIRKISASFAFFVRRWVSQGRGGNLLWSCKALLIRGLRWTSTDQDNKG
jgi:hypothetical protein